MLELAASDDGLTRCAFTEGVTRREEAAIGTLAGEHLRRARGELAEYFDGQRRAFTLALDPRGGEFFRRVWDALRAVPYGATVSYGELARRVGSGARAVGLANARNPIAIIVPCHRVVASDGSLHGYGGGLERKRRLLELEGAATGSLTLFR